MKAVHTPKCFAGKPFAFLKVPLSPTLSPWGRGRRFCSLSRVRGRVREGDSPQSLCLITNKYRFQPLSPALSPMGRGGRSLEGG